VHFRQRGGRARCKVRRVNFSRTDTWNGGLGDVVRIVVQHFVGPGSWHEARSKPSLRIRYVLHLLLLNKAWSASVRASGPHEVSVSGGTVQVRELAVLLRSSAFFARRLQLESSGKCPGARPQTLPRLLHRVADSLLELKLTMCDVTLCFRRVGVLSFPSLLDLTLTGCLAFGSFQEQGASLCGLPTACPVLPRLTLRAARAIGSVAFVAAMSSLQELEIANADHTLDLSAMLPEAAGGGDVGGQLQALRLRWVRGVDVSVLARFRSLNRLTLSWCCCLTGVPLLCTSTSLKLLSHSNNDNAQKDGLLALHERLEEQAIHEQANLNEPPSAAQQMMTNPQVMQMVAFQAFQEVLNAPPPLTFDPPMSTVDVDTDSDSEDEADVADQAGGP